MLVLNDFLVIIGNCSTRNAASVFHLQTEIRTQAPDQEERWNNSAMTSLVFAAPDWLHPLNRYGEL